MIKLIVFDMDGTICDSWPSMLYCYRETLLHYGHADMLDEEFWSYFVGFLPDNLSAMLHISDPEEIDEAVRFFRSKYEEKGHAMSKEFEGIIDVIKELHSKGYKMGLATMTLEKYAINTLKKIGIYDYFDAAHGSIQNGNRSKAEMIRMCMEETGVSPDDTLMIGDGFNDKVAAEKSGVRFIAATYGFGITLDNCKEYGIKYVEKPSDIVNTVMNC